MKIIEHDGLGKTVAYEMLLSDRSTQQDQIKFAAKSIGLFCKDFIFPVSVDLGVGYFDKKWGFERTEIEPKQRFWFLYDKELFLEVDAKATYVNPMQKEAAIIEEDTLARFMEEAIHYEKNNAGVTNDSVFVGWKILDVVATKVLLPSEVKPIDNTIILHTEGGVRPIEYPVQKIKGKTLIYGPIHRYSIKGPLAFSICRDCNLLEMSIHLYWSLWTDPNHKEGNLQITKACKQLEDVGWKRTFG